MSQVEKNLKVVIMAGGIGERLWPKSRNEFPKQFCKVTSDQPMIVDTLERFTGLTDPKNIYISIHQKYQKILKTLLPQIDSQNIILEPMKKDTSPAILLALLTIPANDDAVFLFTPSDHFIRDNLSFKQDILKAYHLTQKTSCMTLLGITPCYPADCYGYIKIDPKQGKDNIFKIEQFVEKPSLVVAREYLNSDQFFWNSGIFMFKKKHLLSLFEKHTPQDLLRIKEYLKLIHEPFKSDEALETFKQINQISFDYAVVEKLKDINCVKANFDWDDVGNWEAFFRIKEKDTKGNIFSGEIQAFQTHDTLCDSEEKKTIVLNGVQDLIIVNTKHTLYITHRNQVNDVKKIIQASKQEIQKNSKENPHP